MALRYDSAGVWGPYPSVLEGTRSRGGILRLILCLFHGGGQSLRWCPAEQRHSRNGGPPWLVSRSIREGNPESITAGGESGPGQTPAAVHQLH